VPGHFSLVKAGDRYGRFVAVARSHRDKRITYWLCRCDCGTERLVSTGKLRRGYSGGCISSDRLRALRTTHGRRKDPLYRVWSWIKDRCLNPRNGAYANYGGRGIRICEAWRSDFVAFAAAVGQRPSPAHSIDRINNDGHYEPGNVRWATRSIQNANTRRHRH